MKHDTCHEKEVTFCLPTYMYRRKGGILIILVTSTFYCNVSQSASLSVSPRFFLIHPSSQQPCRAIQQYNMNTATDMIHPNPFLEYKHPHPLPTPTHLGAVLHVIHQQLDSTRAAAPYRPETVIANNR